MINLCLLVGELTPFPFRVIVERYVLILVSLFSSNCFKYSICFFSLIPLIIWIIYWAINVWCFPHYICFSKYPYDFFFNLCSCCYISVSFLCVCDLLSISHSNDLVLLIPIVLYHLYKLTRWRHLDWKLFACRTWKKFHAILVFNISVEKLAAFQMGLSLCSLVLLLWLSVLFVFPKYRKFKYFVKWSLYFSY